MPIPLKFGEYIRQGLFRCRIVVYGSLVEADLPSAKRKRGLGEVLPALQFAAVWGARLDLYRN